jgi:predicted nucleic acid-binding protein
VKYLVDASVLSEPTKPAPERRVVDWLREHDADLVVDPIVLGELRYGILRLPRGRKRAVLERWFDAGVTRLQCLSWDAEIGLRWAKLLARLHAAGTPMPIKDSLVAATALHHDLTVVTRNRTGFQKAGVRLFDPFAVP